MSLEYIDESLISEKNLISLKLPVRKKLECNSGDKIIFLEDTKNKSIIIMLESKRERKEYYNEKYKK